jgi:probable F420-dependent oxidoreductase
VAHDRRFRFGVMCPRASSAREFRDTARRVEDLGFSTLFVPDHFLDHPLAPIPAMAAAAAFTNTLRVGSLVLGNDYTHPVVLARQAATIDLLSDGRLELGIGAGWMTVEYEKGGWSYDRPSVRIERLAESIAVLKSLLGDGACTFHGKHYTVTDLDGQPKPVQRPHPPIIVGGGGQKILRLAAREADIVGINANLRRGDANDPDAARSLATTATDKKLAWIRDAAGNRYDELEIQTFAGFVHFTDDRSTLADPLAQAFDVEPAHAFDAPVVLVGTREQMIHDLVSRRERWDISYHVIPVEQAQEFAPIVERLANT